MTRIYYLKWTGSNGADNVYTADTIDELLRILGAYLEIDINEKELVNYEIEVEEVPCEEDDYEA